MQQHPLIPVAEPECFAHLARCPGCRAYLQQFRLTVEALRSVPRETAEPENLDELARRFKEQAPPATS